MSELSDALRKLADKLDESGYELYGGIVLMSTDKGCAVKVLGDPWQATMALYSGWSYLQREGEAMAEAQDKGKLN